MANSYFSLNTTAETKVRKEAKLDEIADLSHELVEMKHFEKPTMAELDAFVRVRSATDLIESDFHVASTKGTVAKVLNSASNDDVGTVKKYKYLLEQAFHLRTKSAIAVTPGPVPQLEYKNVLTPNPLTISPKSQTTSDFACFNFTSLADKGEEFMDQQRINYTSLNPDIFATVLMARLPRNLSHRNVTSTNHIVWDFMLRNSRLGAALLKLHGIPLDDLRLRRRKPTDCLICGAYSSEPDIVSGNMIVLEDKDDELGAYLYQDSEGTGFIRAGSAAVGLKKQHGQHVAASKLKTKNDRLSRFYSLYSHDELGKVDGQQGTFQELRQIGAVRFTSTNKARVIGMFEWDNTILTYLEQKEMHGYSLLEKQYRLVCYFFEKLLDLMLGLDQNISSNPGFESFIGYFNNSECL